MTSQTLRSTLVNRLIIILTEDISISETWLIPLSHTIIERYKKLKPDVAPDQEDMRDLATLIYHYCEAKKSRLGSNVNNFYTNYQSLQSEEKYRKFFPEKGETLDSLLQKNDDKDLERRMRIFKFISPTKEQNQTNEHIKICKDKLVPFLQQKMDALGEEHANLKNFVTILLQRFKNMSHKERPRYVFDALFIYIYQDVLDFKKTCPSVDHKVITDTFEKVRMQILIDEDVKIDEFVKDMHTSSKRRDDHAKLYFRTVGAHIENECPLFKFKVFKDKYEEFYESQIKGYLEFAEKYVKVKHLGKDQSEEFVK